MYYLLILEATYSPYFFYFNQPQISLLSSEMPSLLSWGHRAHSACSLLRLRHAACLLHSLLHQDGFQNSASAVIFPTSPSQTASENSCLLPPFLCLYSYRFLSLFFFNLLRILIRAHEIFVSMDISSSWNLRMVAPVVWLFLRRRDKCLLAQQRTPGTE